MSINLIDILNAGVTGYAFLMLLLGYRLTSEVQRKILERESEFTDEKNFRDWKELVGVQLNNTRYFLAFAALFFVGGLLVLMYVAKSEINVEQSPVEITSKESPKLLQQRKVVGFSEQGTATVSANEHETLQLVIKEKSAKLVETRQKIRRLQDQLTTQAISKANSSTDSGFGFSVPEK